ncbi:MAG: KamA family radical SAM protein [Nitrospinota bacterium]|nr:KamA family radical SAM protein [Nitrospinota bacterium]
MEFGKIFGKKPATWVKRPKYTTSVEQINEIGEAERQSLRVVEDTFQFRTNDYYTSLIDWEDPDDPIRQISIPSIRELEMNMDWSLDASCEEDYTRGGGIQHKYSNTVLLLVNNVCGTYCRFCFRKRLFMNDNDEVARNISEGLAYIAENSKITNVLLTGGDPLILSTPKLEEIIRRLREIKHVKIIRIGSKMPAFNPFRILNDPSLPEMLSKYSLATKKIYLMAHFNHPKELTEHSIEAMTVLQRHGVITTNQTPILRGINDSPNTLYELFEKLSYMGVPPYYVFQCRPTQGNEMFSLPLEEAYGIFEKAQSMASGLGKRARFVMSHQTGKIEVIGLTEEQIFMRYHRSPDNANRDGIMVFNRNSQAYWLDDYEEAEKIISSRYMMNPA